MKKSKKQEKAKTPVVEPVEDKPNAKMLKL